MSHVDDGTLHAYLDGALTGVEQAQLAHHLAGCPACRARLDEERALIARAQDVLSRALPPPVRDAAPRRGMAGGGGAPRTVPRWVPYAWAASVLLALGGGWWAARPGRLGEPAPAPVALRPSGTQEPAAAGTRGEQPATVPPPVREMPRAAAPPSEGNGPVAPPPVEGKIASAEAAAAVARAADAPPPQAPTANALQERDVSRAVSTALPSIAGAAAAMAWGPVSMDSARALLGTAPLAVEGVPVIRIRASPAPDGTVLVEQPLSPTVTIRLYQRRAASLEDAAAGREARLQVGAVQADSARVGTERLARYVDGVRVEILGALPVDSLNRLLERLRPMR